MKQDIRNIIDTARVKAGLSQNKLAKLANIDQSRLNAWLGGRQREIRSHSIERLFSVLGIKINS